MKFTFILLTVALLQVSARSLSQNVTINLKDASLEKIFKEIQKQTGLDFLYTKKMLEGTPKINISLNNVPVEKALIVCFKNLPLGFSIVENTIVLKPIEKAQLITADAPPPTEVTGRVTDEDGKPIVGASVIIKGGNTGTKTDNNGNFSIEVNKGDILIFSSVSYESREVKVAATIVNIKLELVVKPLDELIVGGNMTATKRRSDVTSVTVIDSKTLERLPVNTIDQIFRGLVPGTNNFQPSSAAGTGYPTLTIRGASSPSSISAIAVYIDGVEYANGSWYLENLDKNNIDRIEVVRGPGAATLYGTGSNGGIVQIFTKKSKTEQSTVNLTTSAGFYKSKWVKHNPFQQVQSLNITNGYKIVSYSLGGTFRRVGAYLPGGDEKTHNTNGSVSFNLKKFSATINGNYNYTDFGAIRDPSYDTVLHPIIPGLADPAKSVHKRNITESGVADLNVNYAVSDNWKHNLVLGYSNNISYAKPISNDTAIINSSYYYTRNAAVTLRYSNVLQLGKEGDNLKANITSGGEYKNYSYLRIRNGITPRSLNKSTTPNVKNFGAFVQAVPSYKNVYLTAGLRFESDDLFGKAWNPRLGITTNFKTGNIIFKPRISWGKGITRPDYVDRFGLPVTNPNNIFLPNPDIKPQAQQGWDYGLEIFDNIGKFKMEVVRYNNIMDNMISYSTSYDNNIYKTQAINVAKVSNNGWEFSSTYRLQNFTISGNYSIMQSYIKDTTGLSQDLTFASSVPGDRMANLPRHTAGLSLSYNLPKLFGKSDNVTITIGMSEVDGVLSTDFVRWYTDIAYERAPYDFSQEALEKYNITTPAVIKFNLNIGYKVSKNLNTFIQSNNFTNNYKSQFPSYPTYGATWLFGLKYNFVQNRNKEQ